MPLRCTSGYYNVVLKKRGITIVKNENNDRILTRTVTSWRMCIDYKKLNSTPFDFDNNCLDVFYRLKEVLVLVLIMQSLDRSLPFKIMCNTSSYAMGMLDEGQINCVTIEKEFLEYFSFNKFFTFSKIKIIDVTIHVQTFAVKIRWLKLLLDQFHEYDICKGNQ